MKRVLRDNRGGTYIELTFALLMLFSILALFIGVFPIFVKIKKLNDYASFTARMVALEGGITDKVRDGMNHYKLSQGLLLTTEDFSESEFFVEKKIQLNDVVTVKVQDDYTVNLLNIPFSVPLSAKAYSRSEVYHK